MGRKGLKLTDEQKLLMRLKREQTLLERYGDAHYNNMLKNKATKLERYGDEHYNNMEKNRATCLLIYGYEHHNKNEVVRSKISASRKTEASKRKYQETCLQKYGKCNINLVPEIRAKYTETLLKNFGVTNPLKSKALYNKHILTMKENGSFTTSKDEEELYVKLVSMYGEQDVLRQYTDDRYPFRCDFYIKSEDLFIEVNRHPSHGGHPFNPENKEDIELLEELTTINNPWSKMIIDTWTVRDVKKLQIAKENHLNYEVIY